MVASSPSNPVEEKNYPIVSAQGRSESDNDGIKVKEENSARRQTSSSGLTLEQKKTNHIMSENRRRNQIRSSFDRLVQLVPQLDDKESRSEYAILTKTAKYIVQLREENERLEKLKTDRGL